LVTLCYPEDLLPQRAGLGGSPRPERRGSDRSPGGRRPGLDQAGSDLTILAVAVDVGRRAYNKDGPPIGAQAPPGGPPCPDDHRLDLARLPAAAPYSGGYGGHGR